MGVYMDASLEPGPRWNGALKPLLDRNMIVPIFSYGDEPIWLKLLIAAICLYLLGRSMSGARFDRIGGIVRLLGVIAAILSGLALLLNFAPT